MTDNIFAALLRDVPRYTYLSDYGHLEQFMEEADVLAALSAHLDAAIAEQAGEMAKRLDAVSLDVGYSSTTTLDSGVVRQAADLITALLTQIAALRAERDSLLRGHRTLNVSGAKLEDRLTAAEAEVEKLREALVACEAWIADGGHVDNDDVRNGKTGARLVYEQARAAITEAGQ